jgi:hypothetical protein
MAEGMAEGVAPATVEGMAARVMEAGEKAVEGKAVEGKEGSETPLPRRIHCTRRSSDNRSM